MDNIDYEIIRHLQSDGRIPIKKLAEQVCLTPPAVAERIKKLEMLGIIKGYKAVINPHKLGLNIHVIINITISSEKQREFVEFAKNCDNIVKCYHVTGKFSMCIEAVFREMEDLEAMIGKIQKFGNTQTMIVMSRPIESKGITPI